MGNAMAVTILNCAGSQDLRKPSLYAVGRHGSANTAMRTHLWLGYSNETHLNFTVHITQVCEIHCKCTARISKYQWIAE